MSSWRHAVWPISAAPCAGVPPYYGDRGGREISTAGNNENWEKKIIQSNMHRNDAVVYLMMMMIIMTIIMKISNKLIVYIHIYNQNHNQSKI